MGPDWYLDAYEACEEIYAGGWESMSDDERDRAVNDYVFDQADARREIEKESDV